MTLGLAEWKHELFEAFSDPYIRFGYLAAQSVVGEPVREVGPAAAVR